MSEKTKGFGRKDSDKSTSEKQEQDAFFLTREEQQRDLNNECVCKF